MGVDMFIKAYNLNISFKKLDKVLKGNLKFAGHGIFKFIKISKSIWATMKFCSSTYANIKRVSILVFEDVISSGAGILYLQRYPIKYSYRYLGRT